MTEHKERMEQERQEDLLALKEKEKRCVGVWRWFLEGLAFSPSLPRTMKSMVSIKFLSVLVYNSTVEGATELKFASFCSS